MFYKKAKGYQPIAEEGDLEPTTDVIKYYPHEVDGITYHNYDTMGLQDGTNKEKAHVKEIKDIFAKAHLIIYCTKFQEPIRPDDVNALKALTNACGKSICCNCSHICQCSGSYITIQKINWFDELFQKKRRSVLLKILASVKKYGSHFRSIQCLLETQYALIYLVSRTGELASGVNVYTHVPTKPKVLWQVLLGRRNCLLSPLVLHL